MKNHLPFQTNNSSSDTLHLLAQLVEQTSDVLTAADIHYRPVTWNKAAEKVYGLKANDVIGNDLRKFLHIEYSGASREEVRNVINQHGEWRGETSFIRPTDHKLITVWMCFKQMKNNEGDVTGYLISATDITERKESESRLKESEQRFKDMADSSPAMMWMCDENNMVIYNNKKWIEFTGKDITNANDGWEKLIHENDLEKTKKDYYNAFHQKKQVTLVYRLKKADGTYHWVHDISVPRFLSNGKFIGYIGTLVDIEDEKQKHEHLLYQSTILENVSDIIITTDLDFKIKSLNKIAEKFYSIQQTEAKGKRLTHLAPFSFYNTTFEHAFYDLKVNGSCEGEVSINNKGKAVYFLYSVKYVYDDKKNKIGFLFTGKDITGKKSAEEKLRHSETFYRTLIGDSLDGILLLNEEGVITFSSLSVKNVLGYEPEEITGKNGFEFIHPEDISWAVQSFQKEVNENPEIKFITVRLLKKNGEWLWCNVRGHNLLTNPHINNIVVYFHDDTLRKQAKDALQESEKRFRSLIRDLQVGVFLSDDEGNILMCNRALAQMLSLPEEMLAGKNVYDVMSADMINEQNELIPLEERPLTLTIQSKQTVKDAVIGVIHPVTKERSWIMVNADPILNEAGNLSHVVCSVMDLTERKKLEQKLVTDQIAHQKQLTQATIDGQEKERREIGKELHDNIGQQLTTIQLFLDYAKTSADEATLEMVNMALKGVADVINEVRSISHSLVPYSLNDLGLMESVSELIESYKRTPSPQIKFQYSKFDESLLPENQKLALFRIVQEQLNNIVKHAKTKNVSVNFFLEPTAFSLEIKDDGNGFDIKKIRKGLGFINIRNRAELFNGTAEIFSKPGQGCLLTVSFPQVFKSTVEA